MDQGFFNLNFDTLHLMQTLLTPATFVMLKLNLKVSFKLHFELKREKKILVKVDN